LQQHVSRPALASRPAECKRRSRAGRSLRPVDALDTESVLDLQASAGNRAVGHLLAGGPAVQRGLDPTRFSKAGFRQAGLKPGSRLVGQSKFADIEDALDAYHAAKTPADQIPALDKLERKCQAWLGSSYRGLLHSAAKAGEEASKKTEITALLGEVQKERGNLLSTIDTATYLKLKPDRATESLVFSLMRALAIDQTQLKAMTPDTLRSAYINKVLLPFQIDRKAGKLDAPSEMVTKIMYQVGLVDLAKMPDGDTKDAIDKMKQAGLHETNNLMDQPAPKFASGGVSTDQVKPSVPGWADTSTIAITGNLDYRDKVKAMIPIIAGTPVGQMLLAKLGGDEPDIGDGKHPANKAAVVEIKLPPLKVLDYQAPSGDMVYSNSGGKGAVTFDADSSMIGKPGEEVSEPWRLREPVIGLFHELVHVLLAKTDGETWKEAGEKMQVGVNGDVPELRIVGVDYKAKKADGSGEVVFPFSNPARNPITENEFRKQYAASKGLSTFLLRPKYARVPGQVELSTKPQKTS